MDGTPESEETRLRTEVSVMTKKLERVRRRALIVVALGEDATNESLKIAIEELGEALFQ